MARWLLYVWLFEQPFMERPQLRRRVLGEAIVQVCYGHRRWAGREGDAQLIFAVVIHLIVLFFRPSTLAWEVGKLRRSRRAGGHTEGFEQA
ncbi:hypothetical protein D3C76_1506800 [compost metagenome]